MHVCSLSASCPPSLFHATSAPPPPNRPTTNPPKMKQCIVLAIALFGAGTYSTAGCVVDPPLFLVAFSLQPSDNGLQMHGGMWGRQRPQPSRSQRSDRRQSIHTHDTHTHPHTNTYTDTHESTKSPLSVKALTRFDLYLLWLVRVFVCECVCQCVCV